MEMKMKIMQGKSIINITREMIQIGLENNGKTCTNDMRDIFLLIIDFLHAPFGATFYVSRPI